ncbi:AN1-like zinc finger family protein [Hepatocystis sp. ex Piliocolobus tephrosceles]|nr:AN1-like zinc finger family protein [Hepatocystis sp. ex Piliocolobus tephrosceles]
MAYFSDFSKKCDLEGCRIHDFLPFKCQYCELYFCEFHRKTQDHFCSKIEKEDKPKYILCDQCNLSIPYNDEEIKYHLTNKCTRKKIKKPKKFCNQKDCITALNDINTYFCKECKKNYCLYHRHSFSHKCKEQVQGYGFFKAGKAFFQQNNNFDQNNQKKEKKKKNNFCSIQ